MADVRNKSRQDRLRAALRENLKRRKQQAKGRATGADADDRQEDPAGAVENEVSEAAEDQSKQSR